MLPLKLGISTRTRVQIGEANAKQVTCHLVIPTQAVEFVIRIRSVGLVSLMRYRFLLQETAGRVNRYVHSLEKSEARYPAHPQFKSVRKSAETTTGRCINLRHSSMKILGASPSAAA